MRQLLSTAAVAGIHFFGRMSASISHELKNTLSIMNESAGLMEDLSQMALRGHSLDPERIYQLGGLIRRQIQRTDLIIRHMNRFAHSVDDPFKQIALSDLLDLVVAISQRLAEARGVTLRLGADQPPLQVVTRPFYLHHLIWQVIEHSLEAVDADRAIIITWRPEPPGVSIILSGLDRSASGFGRPVKDPTIQTLLDLLGIRLDTDSNPSRMRLLLPLNLDK